MSSPTKVTAAAPDLAAHVGDRRRLARRPCRQLDDTVAALDVGTRHRRGRRGERGQRRLGTGRIGFAHVDDDRSRFRLDPGARAGVTRRSIGEHTEPGEPVGLGDRQRIERASASLGAVAAGDEQDIGEAEAGEVLDSASGHDPDRSPRREVAEGNEQSGQQGGVGGVGDDGGEHPIDVEGAEQRSGEPGDLGGDDCGIVEHRFVADHEPTSPWPGDPGAVRSSMNRSAQPRTSLTATASRSAAIRRVRSVWFMSMAWTIAARIASSSCGLTSTASVSWSAAPANSDNTSTPLTSRRDATYSLATRFIPSRNGVTSITSPAR